jgi:hypothetical protein
VNDNLAPSPSRLRELTAEAKKRSGRYFEGGYNHGSHVDSIRDYEVTAVVVQSYETAVGRRHFMVSEEELGSPLVAATTGDEGELYMVLFRYNVNCRRAHGVSLGFGARRSISRQYKYTNGTFPDWRTWTKLVRATYGVAKVRIA